jgi:hypothetical protein
MQLEDSDEQLARQCEELLWLEEQSQANQVNIDWKQILKRANNDSQCNDLPK